MASNKQRHRPALIALVVVAATVCLGLAWWQLDRFESSSGTGQNLGYALQWPAFAAFCVYAYRKFVVLESDPDEVDKLNSSRGVTEIPEGVLPPRPKSAPAPLTEDGTTDGAQIAEYNRLLAELREADARRAAAADSTNDHPTDNPQRSNQ
jgi:DNA-binding transcriptional regulator of glucitol operon